MKSLVERFIYRRQFKRRFANPGGQGRAIQIDPLSAIDLRLPIKRQVISVFGDKHVRQRGLGWHAARNDMRWRRSLGDPAFAGPASVFGAPGDNHAELDRNDIQPLADILTNHMALSPAGAGELRLNDHLNPVQMFGQ